MNVKASVSILVCVALLFVGCAGKNTSPSTPAPPLTAVQFVAYAEATVAAAETAVALIPGLSASDQQIAQIALSDVGSGLTCVYNEAVSTDSTVLKVQKITACVQSLQIPPQASPQLVSVLNGVYATINAFTTAFLSETAAQQAATVSAITPAAAQPVAQRAAALVKK